MEARSARLKIKIEENTFENQVRLSLALDAIVWNEKQLIIAVLSYIRD